MTRCWCAVKQAINQSIIYFLTAHTHHDVLLFSSSLLIQSFLFSRIPLSDVDGLSAVHIMFFVDEPVANISGPADHPVSRIVRREPYLILGDVRAMCDIFFHISHWCSYWVLTEHPCLLSASSFIPACGTDTCICWIAVREAELNTSTLTRINLLLSRQWQVK